MQPESGIYVTTRDRLMVWHKSNRRDFPWRKSGTSPFHVLVAEMFLRQTRAVVVERVYRKFTNRYPTAKHILEASQDELLDVMRPLGIGSRVSEIRRTAQLIETDFQGSVPNEEGLLRMLPGVGEYTASAIRIFAFDQDNMLVDTNIKRVISRMFNANGPEEVRRELGQLLDGVSKRDYFYMLIDFGSAICRVISPKCAQCPVSQSCLRPRNPSFSPSCTPAKT